MAIILDFLTSKKKLTQAIPKTNSASNGKPAQIIIFSGVRIERSHSNAMTACGQGFPNSKYNNK